MKKINLLFFFSSILLLFSCSANLSRSTNITGEISGYVKVVKKSLQSTADIMPLNGKLVTPYVYTNVVSLRGLPIVEKKEKFFQMLLPAVLAAKTDIRMNQTRAALLLGKEIITPDENSFLDSLKVKYKAKSSAQLLKRLHGFPVSIVLAQAAIESGWGSSRFFLKANNPFGIWSFDKTHNRIEATSNRDGTKIYLRKFDDLEESIDAYYTMLATRQPFAGFRDARLKTQDPYKLIQQLGAYSERGKDYVADLGNMIQKNHLEKYDHYQINPEYLR